MYSQEINAYFYIGIPEARKPLFIIEFIIVIDWSVLFVRKKLFMFIMYVAIHVYFTKNIRKNRLKEKFSRIKGIKVGAYKSYRFFFIKNLKIPKNFGHFCKWFCILVEWKLLLMRSLVWALILLERALIISIAGSTQLS